MCGTVTIPHNIAVFADHNTHHISWRNAAGTEVKGVQLVDSAIGGTIATVGAVSCDSVAGSI